ncbi:hypothetical protein RJ639_007636 [Escallonia herrerae]|uniref:START domain-containing protein n=1 Tax=Escallonia herrerae TaxID=1293975 RepID=A0AA89AUP0_9ASTE|nr:hypothetical protein RJ639_007636 [Escallonia herrerae]
MEKMLGGGQSLMQVHGQAQGSSSSSWAQEFWTNKNSGGWMICTMGVVLVILLWQLATNTGRHFRFFFFRPTATAPNHPSPTLSPAKVPPTLLRISSIVPDSDLKSLIHNLEERFHENEKWEKVIDRRTNLLYYNAQCCKPKDSPLKYLSVTVFEDCSAEALRDFYMDNDNRKQWDKTLIEYQQLQMDEDNGTEIGRIIKKFPLLTPREYILAWRLWEGKNGTYYCFSKECDHPLAPIKKKYVRVGNACEILMVHQEDAGLNVEMAKLAFSKGIWSYVCKMDNALRKYSAISRLKPTSALNAVTLIQKVPSGLDDTDNNGTALPETSRARGGVVGELAHESGKKKVCRRPSNKLVANGLILVGGVICLSRGHSNLASKVAMAYILSKLTKRGACSSSSQSKPVL